MSRLTATFDRLRREGRPGLVTYVTVGFPERDSAMTAVPGLAAGGVDIVELGVPFSDPLADGATIQRSSFRALQNGVTLAFCLETAQRLRAAGLSIPLVLMGYYNPILQMGVATFCECAARVGIDGVIVPDLPPDEADELLPAARRSGLDTIFLLAPTSSPDRIRRVVAAATGFVYCVSVTGVTGARAAFPPDLDAFVQQVRRATDLPIAVGFGVSTPDQFAAVGALADAAIIGSALIERMEQLPREELGPGLSAWARWIRPSRERTAPEAGS